VSFRLEDYRFQYPDALVAVKPAEPRDSARLFVLDRKKEEYEHRTFRDLPDYLKPGDCLVLNRSKVVPARLTGKKPTGGRVDTLFVKRLAARKWTAISAQLKPGVEVIYSETLKGRVESLNAEGEWVIEFESDGLETLIAEDGQAPLPPYIQKRRKTEPVEMRDRERYQTVYAREAGSIAAPTAGMHFTPELLSKIRGLGVEIAELILHVGPGTFRPVKAGDVREHPMLAERFEVPQETPAKLRAAKRVIPVGTTAVRTLETLAEADPNFSAIPSRGEASLFIYPGRPFKAVDALVTNFHQPDSTPILLASAFAGRERLLEAYREAVRKEYRLFSYGDSMLIL
jgi:S-adenosylmethionine:tRNA ribosyltransferase-isomerase